MVIFHSYVELQEGNGFMLQVLYTRELSTYPLPTKNKISYDILVSLGYIIYIYIYMDLSHASHYPLVI